MRKSTAQPFCEKHQVDKKLNSARRYICNQCKNEKRRILRGQNPDFYKEKDKEYYSKKENRERQRLWLIEDRKNNPERYTEYNKKAYEKHFSSRSIIRATNTVGITVQEYMNYIDECNNRCMICNKEETVTRQGRPVKLCIDHCHASFKFRGLLCHRCNSALGMMEDDIERLQSAINYLNKHKE